MKTNGTPGSNPPYRLLYNHDSYCAFQQASPYLAYGEPMGVPQTLGYIDEAANAGCDALLLSPVISSLPVWPSRVCPHPDNPVRREPRHDDTVMDTIYLRLRRFLDDGHDFVQLSADRARVCGLAFFISWRMNELHDIRRGERSPILSRFWQNHPEFRISGPGAKTLWGRALNFAHEAVRDYQFELIRELCSRYPVQGLELDFNRFARFFPSTMAAGEKFRIMGGFVERVRRMLDRDAGGIPLGARVPGRLDLVEEMGLDLPACVRAGWIRMVTVSPFIVTQPDADIEGFRDALPGSMLYGEITHCSQYGRQIDTGVFEDRRITREIFNAAAHGFLERGCDGLSIFNFTYTRGNAFGPAGARPAREPDFSLLHRALDRGHLASRPKHYVLSDDRYSSQLPARLSVEGEQRFRLPIADDLEDPAVRALILRCVLRVRTDAASPPSEFEATLDEIPLEPVRIDGELFPVPAEDASADDTGRRGDFLVPVDRLRKGWNVFSIRLVSTPRVTIERLELALYRTEPAAAIAR